MRSVVVVAFATFVALIAACTSGSDAAPKPKAPKTFTFVGDVRVSGSENVRGSLGNCVGAGEFADVRRGAVVTIADAQLHPIAFGKVMLTSGTNTFEGVLDECSFQFSAVNVPSTPAYNIIVARQPPKRVSRATIVGSNGRFTLDANQPNIPTPGTQE